MMGNDNGSRLTVKVGQSAARNSGDAAREALANLGGEFKLIFVYASIKHKHHKILDEVRRQHGDTPVIGCTTTGEIGSGGVLRDGLVIAGLASDLLEVGVGHGSSVFQRPADATRAAVQMARESLAAAGGGSRQSHVCLVHTAGFTLSQPGVEEDVLLALRGSLGEDWLIVGGSASDGARFLGSRELIRGEVLEQSVVVALLATDLDLHHTMAHGYVPTERSFPVTEAAGNLVKRIDGKLAQDFYAELLGVTPQQLTKGLGLIRMTKKVPKFLSAVSQKVGLTPQVITEKIAFFGHATENPFGVQSDSSGAFVVKVPKLITTEGWLEFQTRMDDVDRLTLMKLDPEATVTASARAVAAASENAAHPPKLILIFECLGRYMYLLDQVEQLFQSVRQATDAEIAGFFSAAEQGTMQGMSCQSHNYSTAVLGLG
jgi:hypothetical protein